MPGQDLQGATIKTMKYSVDIGANLAVVCTANADEVALPAAAGAAKCAGFTMEAGKAGEYHPVHVSGGLAWATSSAAINPGDLCDIAAATGKIRTAAPASGVDTNLVAKALGKSGADGDVIAVVPVHGSMQGQ